MVAIVTDQTRVLFLGGPAHGCTFLVGLPLPHTVLVDPPRTTPIITWDPEEITALPPLPVEYHRRPRGRNGCVYVTADYDPPPALPLIPRRFADILEQHGMRDGVDFRVYLHEPPGEDRS